MPTYLFIDTSSLPRSYANKGAAYSTLFDLARLGAVKVYLSEVVVREKQSQWASQIPEWIEDLPKLKKGVASLDREAIELADKLFQRLGSNSEKLSQDAMAEFVDSLNADVIRPDGRDLAPVWDAYFAGSGAFRIAKNRDDIPDAFILQAAERALALCEDEQLHVIAADGQLRKAAQQLERVEIHSSLKGFLESSDGKAVISRIDWEPEWESRLSEATAGIASCESSYENDLDEAVAENLPGERLSDTDRPFAPTVGYTTKTGKWTFLWPNTESIGPGWLSVPLSGEVEAEIDEGDMFEESLIDLMLEVEGIAEIRISKDEFASKSWGSGILSVELTDVRVA